MPKEKKPDITVTDEKMVDITEELDDDGERLKTPRWAAAYLGLSVRSIYRMIEEESIPYIRIGRAIRLRKSELDDWLMLIGLAPGEAYRNRQLR